MKKKIDFFTEDIDFELKDKSNITKLISDIFVNERFEIEFINFIFCSDNYLLDINTRYLDHNYFTDIVSFNYNNGNEPISGDIFISIPRIKENSKEYFVTFESELKRVIIHGVLHLIGYEDKSSIEKKLMTDKEDFYLAKIY